MAELNMTDGDVLTSTETDLIDQQLVIQCTSSTRPTGIDGRMIFETDTEKYLAYDASTTAWNEIGSSRWVTFTPSFANVTVGSGTTSGEYRYVAGGIRVRAEFTYGSGSSVTGTVSLTVPNSETSRASGPASLGVCQVLDAGTRVYVGNANCALSSNTINFAVADGASYLVNATSPMTTWATGDEIRVDIVVAL